MGYPEPFEYWSNPPIPCSGTLTHWATSLWAWHPLLLADVLDQATISRLSMGYHGTAFHADAGDHAPQKTERNSGLITPSIYSPPAAADTIR